MIGWIKRAASDAGSRLRTTRAKFQISQLIIKILLTKSPSKSLQRSNPVSLLSRGATHRRKKAGSRRLFRDEDKT
jgi:hypothetical protein